MPRPVRHCQPGAAPAGRRTGHLGPGRAARAAGEVAATRAVRGPRSLHRLSPSHASGRFESVTSDGGVRVRHPLKRRPGPRRPRTVRRRGPRPLPPQAASGPPPSPAGSWPADGSILKPPLAPAWIPASPQRSGADVGLLPPRRQPGFPAVPVLRRYEERAGRAPTAFREIFSEIWRSFVAVRPGAENAQDERRTRTGRVPPMLLRHHARLLVGDLLIALG
jgi:hypothetical protein